MNKLSVNIRNKLHNEEKMCFCRNLIPYSRCRLAAKKTSFCSILSVFITCLCISESDTNDCVSFNISRYETKLANTWWHKREHRASGVLIGDAWSQETATFSSTHLEFRIWSIWLCVSSKTHWLSCSFSLFCATAKHERVRRINKSTFHLVIIKRANNGN